MIWSSIINNFKLGWGPLALAAELDQGRDGVLPCNERWPGVLEGAWHQVVLLQRTQVCACTRTHHDAHGHVLTHYAIHAQDRLTIFSILKS